MTRDQLPEKLRNLPGLELVDPNRKDKIVVKLPEEKWEEMDRIHIPIMKRNRPA